MEQDASRKKQEEAERAAQAALALEAARKAEEERAQLETERKAKEEADRQAREEQERQTELTSQAAAEKTKQASYSSVQPLNPSVDSLPLEVKRYKTRWVLTLAVLLSIGVMIYVGLMQMSGGNRFAPTLASEKDINVVATEFQFQPNTFDGKAGEKLTFNVTNKGVVEHTFVIRNLDGIQELVKLSAQPGETKSLDFIPQKAGIYPIECDIAGHKEAGETGELVVK